MNSFLYHIAIVLLPLLISNSLHMLIVKRDDFDWLKYPISKKIFGKNKTWRGFVFVPLVNAFVLLIIDWVFYLNITTPFYLGFVLGVAYMIFELPNSFIKRRLGISPGDQSKSYKILFLLFDKTDSAFGVNLIYFLISHIHYQDAMILFISSSLIHVLMSKALLKFKLKKSF